MPIAEKAAIFPQMPYSKVSEKEFAEMRRAVRPIDWDLLYDGGDALDAAGERYCNNDVCEMP